MNRLDQLKQARAQVRKDALERYLERAPEREDTRRKILAGGPGAADSAQRQSSYLKRIVALDQIRVAAAVTRVPLGLERKMGASLDWSRNPGEAAVKAGRPVARIIELADEGSQPEGFATGFLIAPDLLMTNWHVFETRADVRGCGANFLYERSGRGVRPGVIFEFRPDRFFISDKALDFAIVAVEPRSLRGDILADLGQISLIEARPKILKGQPVNIIQHPEGGPKEYALSQNLLIDILEAEGFLQYETDTLEGSSGSPAFSKDWELVALHHASIPEIRNGKPVDRHGNPWNAEMSDEDVNWVANEGTRVSAIVGRLAGMQAQSTAEQSILRQLVESTSDPVAEAGAEIGAGLARSEIRRPEPGAQVNIHPGELSMSGIQFTFTGPVTINVGAATPLPIPVVPDAARVIGVEKVIRFDPDYDHRPGYDDGFLGGGIKVPAPKVHPDRLQEIYMGEDGEPLVLTYHHFEVVMNKVRRLQMWSAVNVDYDPKYKTDMDRDAWGSDKWIPDPRIPANIQVFDADFYKPAGNIDRGHIVRREDNEWGKTPLEIEYANSDTFHWTNCTPQHEAFNQSVPGRNDRTYRGMEGIWGAFENYVQQSRKGDDTKASILAGPVLAPDDPSADFGRGIIKYPLAFWKVICVAEEVGDKKELRAFGFWLTQNDVVDRFGIETFRPGRFKRYQLPISEIGQRAGIVFDKKILRADTMATETIADKA